MDSDPDSRISSLSIQDNNLELLHSKIFSDVTFVVGETKEEIHAHKSILIRASPVFETQFGDRWTHEDEIEILIPDVSPKAFRLFLEYLYADIFTVTEIEAPEVLSLAHMYLTNCLGKKCTDLLSSVINVSNVTHIHQTAAEFNEKNLEKKAMEFILMNARAVFKDIGFLQTGKDALSQILKSDQLATEEIVIFRAVMRWAENKCKEEKLDCTVQNKRIVLNDLIPLIRFTLMTPEEFTNEVCVGQHEGILSAEESNSVYKYWNDGSSMRTHLPSFPLSVDKRRHENLYQVDVYEAGFGHFNGINCRHEYTVTESSITLCTTTLRLRSDRNIQLLGIELRQPTQSEENPLNSTYLAFTDPKSASKVDSDSAPESAPPLLSDVSVEIYPVRESTWWNRGPVGIFVPMALESGFETGIQIEKNCMYHIILNIRGGSGQSALKSISPGVGLKLANPARVSCDEGDVVFKFDIRWKSCFRQDLGEYRRLDNCICNGLIKAIHFKI